LARLKKENKVKIFLYKSEQMKPIEIIWRFKNDYELKIFLASIFNVPIRQIKQIKFAMYEHFRNLQEIEQPCVVLEKANWHHFKNKMNTKRRFVFFIDKFKEDYLVEVVTIKEGKRTSKKYSTH